MINEITLINTQQFHALANTLGTIAFILAVLWAIWFASKMD